MSLLGRTHFDNQPSFPRLRCDDEIPNEQEYHHWETAVTSDTIHDWKTSELIAYTIRWLVSPSSFKDDEIEEIIHAYSITNDEPVDLTSRKYEDTLSIIKDGGYKEME